MKKLGTIIWLTGQPGAGKTTLAELLKVMRDVDFIIDGDDLRAIQPESYDARGRFNNVSRAQDIALYLSHQGHNVACALVSPIRAQREWLKERAPVLEVYVHTSQVRGREEFHTKDYEKPQGSFLDVDTTSTEPIDCARAIRRALSAVPSRARVADTE